jgi:hypothetical protein
VGNHRAIVHVEVGVSASDHALLEAISYDRNAEHA